MIQPIIIIMTIVIMTISKEKEVSEIKAENEMDRHHESMANLIKDEMNNRKIKQQHRLIKLYENEIKRLERLNDNMLNELRRGDVKYIWKITKEE